MQTSQFPRATDLAHRFRALGLAVIIGGFHVSGTLALTEEVPAPLASTLLRVAHKLKAHCVFDRSPPPSRAS